MLIWLTDNTDGKSVAFDNRHVARVFTTGNLTTIETTPNGYFFYVKEDILDVVSRFNTAE